jgi:hypothetical protein
MLHPTGKASPMNDHHDHFVNEDHLQEIMKECPAPKKVGVSPLGWSITGRLIFAVAGSVALWMAVAWALGWLT